MLRFSGSQKIGTLQHLHFLYNRDGQ